MHTEPHPQARETVSLKKPISHPMGDSVTEITIQDWWDKLTGGSWQTADGNPAYIVYAIRTGSSSTPPPIDDEVVYGHDPHGFGVLVHVSEIEASKKEA